MASTSYRVWDDTKSAGTCRNCQAAVEWFEMVSTGKRHPFNAGVVYVRTEKDADTGRLIGVIDSVVSPWHFGVLCSRGER